MKQVKTLLSMTLAALAVSTPTHALAAQIYWCDFGGNVYRVNLDGTGVEHLIDLDPGGFSDIALDVAAGKMYLADGMNNRLLRANLDGTSIETVVADVDLNGVALDTLNQKIYWTISAQDDAIQRASLDGTGIENVLHPAWLSSPHKLAIDAIGERLYWTGSAQSSGAIRRVKFNGADVQNLVLHQYSPRGIALDLDEAKVYWANADLLYAEFGTIRRSNLDGTEVEGLLTDLATPYGLALDVDAGKMYWTEHYPDGLWRADLDGTRAELLVSGESFYGASGIALDLTPIPEPSSILLLCMACFLFFSVHILQLRRGTTR